jgi:hypothetical protein
MKQNYKYRQIKRQTNNSNFRNENLKFSARVLPKPKNRARIKFIKPHFCFKNSSSKAERLRYWQLENKEIHHLQKTGLRRGLKNFKLFRVGGYDDKLTPKNSSPNY